MPADAEVAERLYRRALGYEHSSVKIFADPKTGAQLVVPYTERFPPDTTACITWLKNRRPDLWRDRTEVTGKNGGPVLVAHTAIEALGDLMQQIAPPR
jgi:hypothetical protein